MARAIIGKCRICKNDVPNTPNGKGLYPCPDCGNIKKWLIISDSTPLAEEIIQREIKKNAVIRKA
jgi:hypothetical protein